MKRPLRSCAAHGVEIERTIVEPDSLAVRPLAEVVSRDAGWTVSDLAWDDMGVANEPCAGVLARETNGPARRLSGLAARFQRAIPRAEDLLAARGAPAERIARPAGPAPTASTLRGPCARLADCLAHGAPFVS